MSDTTRLEFETLVNFDGSTLTGTFQAINGTGTANPLNVMKFYNSTTSLVVLSYDGVNEHDFIPPGGSFIVDIEANADGFGGSSGHKHLPAGTIIYAKTSSNTDRLMFVGYH